MAYPKKIVLNCPHGASSKLTPIVEEFIRDEVMFVEVVGKDCSLVERLGLQSTNIIHVLSTCPRFQ